MIMRTHFLGQERIKEMVIINSQNIHTTSSATSQLILNNKTVLLEHFSVVSHM